MTDERSCFVPSDSCGAGVRLERGARLGACSLAEEEEVIASCGGSEIRLSWSAASADGVFGAAEGAVSSPWLSSAASSPFDSLPSDDLLR